jgi:hypothetical protein
VLEDAVVIDSFIHVIPDFQKFYDTFSFPKDVCVKIYLYTYSRPTVGDSVNWLGYKALVKYMTACKKDNIEILDCTIRQFPSVLFRAKKTHELSTKSAVPLNSFFIYIELRRIGYDTQRKINVECIPEPDNITGL